MAKDMSNNDIVDYEGGDYGEIMDNYNLHEITAAIVNRAGKAYNAFKSIEEEVEEIKNNPDVVDIVATYADLQAYDTQHLTDKDIIRVLQDETHDGESTYYRYNKQDDTWTYVGESKQYTNFVGTDGTTGGQNGLVPAPAATDAGKFLNANGSWEEVASGGGITELTTADYNWPANNPDGIALWLLDAGIYSPSETVKVYTTANDYYYAGVLNTYVIEKTSTGQAAYTALRGTSVQYGVTNSDGTASQPQAEALSNANLVQTTGTSTTNVMSQNAVTSMVYADPGTNQVVNIGGSTVNGSYATAIGKNTSTNGNYAVALGSYSRGGGAGSVAVGGGTSSQARTEASGNYSISIGSGALASGTGSIALGRSSVATRQGEMNIGSNSTVYGYNNSFYRLLTGLYDGQSAHDAATKGQLDSIAIQNAGAPTTSTTGSVGQLLEDTTNGKLYICTAVDTTDPQNPSYTWTEVGAGGGSGSGITELTSADYNYPTSAPTTIGIWNLAPGLYYTGNGVNTKLAASETNTTAAAYWFIGTPTTSDPNNVAYYKIDATDGSNIITGVSNKTTGAVITAWTRYLTRANVLNTTGTNTAYPMSQNAVTSMVYADPANKQRVQIGIGANGNVSAGVAIGSDSTARTISSIAIGSQATAGSSIDTSKYAAIAIGANSEAYGKGSIALGRRSSATAQGEMNIGTSETDYGYNSSNYRLLTGLYDPQSAHDAATKGYVDAQVGNINTALQTLLNGTGA